MLVSARASNNCNNNNNNNNNENIQRRRIDKRRPAAPGLGDDRGDRGREAERSARRGRCSLSGSIGRVPGARHALHAMGQSSGGRSAPAH